MTKAAQAMKKAWEVFKETGIRTMEAWKSALRQAWAFVKGVVKMSVKIKMQIRSNRDKAWVAEIVGTNPKFKFERAFIQPVAWIRGTNEHSKTFELKENTIYQVCDPAYETYFAIVENGQEKVISENEVTGLLV